MLDTIELWQVPLLVGGVILLGNLVYSFAVNRSSRVTAARIKLAGVAVLVMVALILSYRLIRLDDFPIVVSLVTLVLDVFVAWIAVQELKELRLVKMEREQLQQAE